jgi:hypothetical protein
MAHILMKQNKHNNFPKMSLNGLNLRIFFFLHILVIRPNGRRKGKGRIKVVASACS